MSNINRTQYENAAQLYLRQNPKNFERYYSPTLLKTLVDAMLSSLPTTVTAGICFNRLVANGQLARTDGKNEADDAAENYAAAEANLNAVISEVDSAPLSAAELEYFGSLSQRELSKLYYGEDGRALDEFSIRYRRAAREHMFRIPERFQSAEASTAEGDVTLSAREYNAMPSAELKRRLREPGFAAAVSKLIQRGEI
jgi:hypothetical protein